MTIKVSSEKYEKLKPKKAVRKTNGSQKELVAILQKLSENKNEGLITVLENILSEMKQNKIDPELLAVLKELSAGNDIGLIENILSSLNSKFENLVTVIQKKPTNFRFEIQREYGRIKNVIVKSIE